MARKLILFQWTGWAPLGDGRKQVSCAAAFESKAAFRRATDTKLSEMPWISVDESGRAHSNEGAALALAHPGVVYYKDTVNFVPSDAPWLVHPNPERS